MKTNKEQVIEQYETLVNTKLPGKGEAARQIVEKYWDAEADTMTDSRIKELDHSVNLNCAMMVLKDLGTRRPEFAAEIKTLK
jgi:hypothetical protein